MVGVAADEPFGPFQSYHVVPAISAGHTEHLPMQLHSWACSLLDDSLELLFASSVLMPTILRLQLWQYACHYPDCYTCLLLESPSLEQDFQF